MKKSTICIIVFQLKLCVYIYIKICKNYFFRLLNVTENSLIKLKSIKDIYFYFIKKFGSFKKTKANQI